MTPRCSYPITRRRTCGAELTSIYRFCPEHMLRPGYELQGSDSARELAQEYVDYYAGVADEVEDR